MLKGTFVALYICLSGPFCPELPQASQRTWPTLRTCQDGAAHMAKTMHDATGNNYMVKCYRAKAAR